MMKLFTIIAVLLFVLASVPSVDAASCCTGSTAAPQLNPAGAKMAKTNAVSYKQTSGSCCGAGCCGAAMQMAKPKRAAKASCCAPVQVGVQLRSSSCCFTNLW